MVTHQFGCVEFRVFVLVFYRQAAGGLENIKSNIEIQHVQIDELPRTKRPDQLKGVFNY